MDIGGIVEAMVTSDGFLRVVNNPLAQFGTGTRRYLGATLLPEETRPENSYKEQAIRFRTVIANDSTRYSPVQKKGNVLFGSMDVVLGDSDIGSEFTGRDYDGLVRLLQRYTGAQGADAANPPTMQAIATLTQWADTGLVKPLMEKNEKMRWEAICGAQVIRTGDNGYREVVPYPNPTNTRVNAAGAWSNNSYDPWVDIMLGVETLAALGFTVNRMVASTPVRTKLSNNTNVKLRAGHLAVAANGTVATVNTGHVPLNKLNELFDGEELPPLEIYDLQYRTQTGSFRFMPNNVFCMFATTDRDMNIDLGDLQNLFERGQGESLTMPNTIGYVGVGRGVGQSEPGRTVFTEAFANKPPRVEGESWQTTLPVITEATALYIIGSIT